MEEGIVAFCVSVARSSLLLGHEHIVVGFAAGLDHCKLSELVYKGQKEVALDVQEVDGTGGRADKSLKTCLGSRNLGSIN